MNLQMVSQYIIIEIFNKGNYFNRNNIGELISGLYNNSFCRNKPNVTICDFFTFKNHITIGYIVCLEKSLEKTNQNQKQK